MSTTVATSTTPEPLPIAIRRAEPGDREFVFATWLRGFRSNSRDARRITNRIFYAFHHLLVEQILARDTVEVLVACDREAPHVLYGFVCLERIPAGVKIAGIELPRTIVHYAHTKLAFQRLGVQRALFAHAQVDLASCAISHLTGDAEAALARLFPANDFGQSDGPLHIPYLRH